MERSGIQVPAASDLNVEPHRGFRYAPSGLREMALWRKTGATGFELFLIQSLKVFRKAENGSPKSLCARPNSTVASRYPSLLPQS